MNDNPKIEGQLQQPAERVVEIRKSAFAGAASVFGRTRLDVIDDIISVTLIEIARRQGGTFLFDGAGRIRNHRAYAYRVARRAAQNWLKAESKFVSFDAREAEEADRDSNGSGVSYDDLVAGSHEPMIADADEILAALPELFERFQIHVLANLEKEDQLFFEARYIKRLSAKQLADELGIKPSSACQRCRRLLGSIQKGLLAELRSWPLGKELFLDTFRDPDRFAEFLALLRIYLEEGREALKILIDSMRG